jgi:tetratricopeptide (TPR) repeat protein
MNSPYQDQRQRHPRFIFDPLIPPLAHVVGREQELLALKQRLCTSDNGTNMAIIGLPGVGKTTLAIAVALDADIRAHFHDGILWVGLGTSPHHQQHITRWGALLGISTTEMGELNNEARKKALQSLIKKRRMLLILDDAWKLEDVLAFQIGGSECVHLVTTRSSSLATTLVSYTPLGLNELNSEQSLDLLHVLAPQIVQREPESARTLVQAVGGLPLALTLAGNYLRQKSYHGLTRQIHTAMEQLESAETRLNLSEPRSPAAQHPSLPFGQPISLHTMISLTDQQLSAQARTTLYALSVLPAKPESFSEEAALAVSACPLSILDELLDIGLLESVDQRYTFHQTIADYARLHLKSLQPQERLITYAADFLERHAVDYEFLDREYSTLLIALETAYTLNKQEDLLRLVCAFAPFFLLRGNYKLAHTHLDRAYQTALALDNQAGIIDILHYYGQIAQKQGRYADAQDFLQQSLDKARHLEDANVICALLKDLGWTVLKRGELAQAETYFLEGLALAQETKHQKRISELLAMLGTVAARQGNYGQSETYLREGLALARQTGDREELCVLLINLGATIHEQGKYEQARACFEEGLTFARQIGHHEWTSALLCNLGSIASFQGEYAQAAMYQREGLELARLIGQREWMSILLLNLGETAVAQGLYTHADLYLEETLNLAQQLGRPQITARALYELGNLRLHEQKLEEAEVALREMQEIIPSGDQELHALFLYGQARLAASRGQIQQAQHLGETSATAFEEMGHHEAQRVKKWLASIIAPHSPLADS